MYADMRRLAQGSYGIVKLAYNEEDNNHYVSFVGFGSRVLGDPWSGLCDPDPDIPRGLGSRLTLGSTDLDLRIWNPRDPGSWGLGPWHPQRPSLTFDLTPHSLGNENLRQEEVDEEIRLFP